MHLFSGSLFYGLNFHIVLCILLRPLNVTSFSQDTQEPNLLELLCTFGPVTRIYVVMDQKIGTSIGFGFVNFVNKDDAQRAINKLNGYGYDSLILRIEWATPRSN
ncbi:hypothetical protein REPUB_Repub07fG0125200 [Reevesia pubescens]